MTQAFNLSQFANNLDSTGKLDAADGLVNAVPIGNGGTGATTQAAAQSNLNVPSRTGANASGTWAINITGSAASASSASSVTTINNASGGTVQGDIYATGNVTAYSDRRLKTEIETISHALLKVNNLIGRTYIKDGKREIGLVAQETQKVIPEVVYEGEYLSVAYGNIVGLLVEAIKELSKEVEALKVKNG